MATLFRRASLFELIVCSIARFKKRNKKKIMQKKEQSSIARAFSDSRINRSAFIDNVDVEQRNKAAVIAELTYGCVCSLAPGDAATLISKPKSTPAGRTFRIKVRLNGRIAIAFSRCILIHIAVGTMTYYSHPYENRIGNVASNVAKRCIIW